jgi:hypothetical protein
MQFFIASISYALMAASGGRFCPLVPLGTPNGKKLHPAEAASYDLVRYILNDPLRIFN